MATADDTVARLFWRATRERGDTIAMRRKSLGIWQGVTWREAGERVRGIAGALLVHGVGRGERVAIISQNRPEWLFADLAAQGVGAIGAGIDPAADVAPGLRASGARIVFVENDEQLDKVLRARPGLPAVTRIVVFDMEGLFGFQDADVTSFADFAAAGEAWNAANPGAVEAALAAGIADEAAILTADGATVSHRNLLARSEALLELAPAGHGDNTLSFRPLADMTERCHALVRPLLAGGVVNFAEHPEAAAANLREVAPHVLAATPEFWARLRGAVDLALVESTNGERRAVAWAQDLGGRIADLRRAGRRAPAGLALLFKLADLFVLGRVKTRLGLQRARLLVSEGGALPADLRRWFEALDLTMIEAAPHA